MAHEGNTNKVESGLIRVIADLRNPHEFPLLFQQVQKLGQGGDGEVYSYLHVTSKAEIAVKFPLDGSGNKYLLHEIRANNWIESAEQEHIVTMLLSHKVHASFMGPVIFMELCHLGDLTDYRTKWCNQEFRLKKPQRPSEVTLWKLLKDMSLALDHLHNSFTPTVYIHNDIKPHNIFVTYPDGWAPADGIPAEPVFKLGDFSRMAQYPPIGFPAAWRGTPEYAPPPLEQGAPVKPATDVFGVGATIQAFALNITPTQSRTAFIEMRRKQGLTYPFVDDQDAWNSHHWRKQRGVVYRPLNVSVEVLKAVFDCPSISSRYKPYSNRINSRYTALMELDVTKRITAKDLVKHVVPLIDGEIAALKLGSVAVNSLTHALKKYEG